MKTEAIRDIFARFQNLNLVVLREDLRRDIVANGDWIEPENQTLCPLAHGFTGRVDWRKFEKMTKPLSDHKVACRELGVRRTRITRSFTMWWDSCFTDRRILAAIIDDIFAERLADADIVQAVIAEPVCAS